jgi:hypothetical protein
MPNNRPPTTISKIKETSLNQIKQGTIRMLVDKRLLSSKPGLKLVKLPKV